MNSEDQQDIIQAKINAAIEKYQTEIEATQKFGAQLGKDSKTSL